MDILSIGTGLPDNKYTTDELLSVFPNFSDKLREVLRNKMGVESRYAVLPDPAAVLRNEILPEESCSDLGKKAAIDYLEKYGLHPEDVDLLITATDTSDYITPSMGSQVIYKLGLTADTPFYNLGGMGCSAMVKSLEMAEIYLHRYPDHKVLLIVSEAQSPFVRNMSTLGQVYKFGEINSMKDISDEERAKMIEDTLSVIQFFLFGDGAAAFLLSKTNGIAEFVCSANATNLQEGDTELVYFPEGGSYRPNLTANNTRPHLILQTDKVGRRGSEYGEYVMRKLKQSHRWPQEIKNFSDISEWMVHPGSKVVLDVMTRNIPRFMSRVFAPEKSGMLNVIPKLNRNSAGVQASYRCLKDLGNLSGAALGFILKDVCYDPSVKSGSYGLMLGFGAGFSASASVLRFR